MPNIKTAISIQKTLLEQVEQLARTLKIPRNRVFARAVEEFVQRQDNHKLLAQMNAAYQDAPDASEQPSQQTMRASHRRLVEGEW